MAFIHRIANKLVESEKKNEEIAQCLESCPEWGEYYKTDLAITNETENKPLGEDPRNKKSSWGDDQEIDFLFRLKNYKPGSNSSGTEQSNDDNDKEEDDTDNKEEVDLDQFIGKDDDNDKDEEDEEDTLAKYYSNNSSKKDENEADDDWGNQMKLEELANINEESEKEAKQYAENIKPEFHSNTFWTAPMGTDQTSIDDLLADYE